MQSFDVMIIRLDKALRVISGITSTSRPNPAMLVTESHTMNLTEQRHSAGLMRVNHVGEVCAQALYQAQGKYSQSKSVKEQFAQAELEEEDHLAWTAQRLRELNSHPSILNPLWYAGAYILGSMAAQLGDAASLGFVVETERQVEAHLTSHLKYLPVQDTKSRAIVEQMRLDEVAHGALAQSLGARNISFLPKKIMQAMAKVMTTTAYYI